MNKQLKLCVLKVSDTRTEATDTVGSMLVEMIQSAGHQVVEKVIVKDDKYAIRAATSNWIASPEVDVIISTGGTGITGRDGTPEAVSPLLDKEIEGFGELFRTISYEEIGVATMQSRAIAGVANSTYIFCLPGSKGACKTAWEKIIALQLNPSTRPCNLVELIPRLSE